MKEDDCYDCHNCLLCLEWAKEGAKANCKNWNYFKKHYVNGSKRSLLEDELKEC